MIRLTRLNNHPLVVNADLIKFVEQAPDTLITLINGEKFMVREDSDQIVHLVIEFRRAVLKGISTWDRSFSIASKPAGPGTTPGTSEE